LIKDGYGCQNKADVTINNDVDYETTGANGVHTQYTCHELCQEDKDCESFDLFDDGTSTSTCKLYHNGICESGDETNTNMYAKSNFWEDPLVLNGRCTHLSTYSNDAIKVQVCKDQDADEATCLLNGNFYTASADAMRCSGTAYRVISTTSALSPAATDATDGYNKCAALCTS
jgi:hypothetical protein